MGYYLRRERRRLYEEGYIGTPLSSTSRAILSVKLGEEVEGTVVKKEEENYILRIGDGLLALLPDSETEEEKAPGSRVKACVKDMDPISARVVVSEKDALERHFFDECLALCEEGAWLEGPLLKAVKGGYLIPIKDLSAPLPQARQAERMAVLPFSQVVPPPVNPAERLNQVVRFRIMQVDVENKKIVLTQKGREKKPIAYTEGMRLKGTVTKIVPYGVFVRIGEQTGLVHKSEISWLRVHDIADVIQEGETVEVQVLRIDEENEKVSLSVKRCQENPWEKADQYFQPGQVTEGKVIRHVPFGIFMSLTHGLEGLLHASELEEGEREKREELYPTGTVIPVKVLTVDKENFRIALAFVR